MTYDLLIRNGRIVDGSGMPAFRGDVGVKDGKIAEIGKLSGPATRVVDAHGAVVAPGFIDIQVNGGGGVLFNDTPDVATIGRIGAAHRRFGTTGFLPTLISDTPDKLPLALAAAGAVLDYFDTHPTLHADLNARTKAFTARVNGFAAERGVPASAADRA
mgnify:CR=1 FL=1